MNSNITDTEMALAYFEQCRVLRVGNGKHNRTAVIALRAQAERENPKPLTLTELCSRGSWEPCGAMPVFIQNLKRPRERFWDLVRSDGEDFSLANTRPNSTYQELNYGKTWLAYATEPKEER